MNACGECNKSARCAGTLRCLHRAPKNADGQVARSSIQGAPYCEQVRSYGWILARLLGVCGREGRYWNPTTVSVPEEGPILLWGALIHDDETSGYVHSDRTVVEQWAARNVVDGLYAIAPVRIERSVP